MRIVAVAAMLIALLALATPAAAQGPTATPTATPYPTLTPWPTLHPLTPTATSKYEGFRITPTPFPITPGAGIVNMPDFHGEEAGGQIADTIINSYRALNVGGALDFVSFVGMAGLVIVFLLRIQTRSTRNHD